MHTTHATATPTVDVETRNEGSIFVFSPPTPDAHNWFAQHVGDEAQWFGGSLMVEWRYAPAIAEGLIGDGLVVKAVR